MVRSSSRLRFISRHRSGCASACSSGLLRTCTITCCARSGVGKSVREGADSRRAYARPARRVNAPTPALPQPPGAGNRELGAVEPALSLQLELPAPCSPLPAPFVALPKRREVNHSSPHRRLADLGQCDGDHHEVVADLLQAATFRYATTGRPGARLLRGAALRACHGCDVRSGHATRKSLDSRELMPV